MRSSGPWLRNLEYLLGHKCLVYTDNNPLSHLATARLGATEQRWAAELAAFDFEVRYRSGKSNRNADALSRQDPTAGGIPEGLVGGSAVPASLHQAISMGRVAQAVVNNECFARLFCVGYMFPAGS